MTELVEQELGKRKGGGGGGGGGGLRAPQKPLLTPVPIRNDLTVAWANRYIPFVKEVQLIKDLSFHYRWQGVYPSEPPLTRYCGQGSNVSSGRDALVYVLRQLWKWHEEATGESCPFDFSTETV